MTFSHLHVHGCPAPSAGSSQRSHEPRIIKYKYTRYYLEWLQMACLEHCIKWSWNLVFGAEKENFSPLILSLEV